MAEQGVAGATIPTVGLDESEVQALRDLLNFVGILQDYVNDQVLKDVSGIVSSVFKLVNAMSSTDLIGVLERAVQDPQLDKALLDPPQIGPLSLLGALRDEDVQRGIGILMELLKAFGQAAREA